MDGLDARWAFLRPWCALLRGRLTVGLEWTGRVPAIKYLGLSVALAPSDTDADLCAVRAAMLLLARVDFWAWKHVLSAHCGADVDPIPGSFESEAFRESRFVLGLTTRPA